MEFRDLVAELGLTGEATIPELVKAYDRVCESCRETISESQEKAVRRMAKRKLQEVETEIGPTVNRLRAKAEVDRQLEQIQEVVRTASGSPAPYFEEIDNWLPLCEDHNLELKVASIRKKFDEPSETKKDPAPVVMVSNSASQKPPSNKLSQSLIRETDRIYSFGGIPTQIVAKDSVVFGRTRKIAGCDVGVPLNENGIPPESLPYRKRIISRKHFHVIREDGRVSLFDGFLDSDGNQWPSTGGLYLNGERVNAQAIERVENGLMTLSGSRQGIGIPAFALRWCSNLLTGQEVRELADASGLNMPQGRSLIFERADGFAQRVLLLFGTVSGSIFGDWYSDLQIIRLDDGYFFNSSNFGPLKLSDLEKRLAR